MPTTTSRNDENADQEGRAWQVCKKTQSSVYAIAKARRAAPNSALSSSLKPVQNLLTFFSYVACNTMTRSDGRQKQENTGTARKTRQHHCRNCLSAATVTCNLTNSKSEDAKDSLQKPSNLQRDQCVSMHGWSRECDDRCCAVID